MGKSGPWRDVCNLYPTFSASHCAKYHSHRRHIGVPSLYVCARPVRPPSSPVESIGHLQNICLTEAGGDSIIPYTIKYRWGRLLLRSTLDASVPWNLLLIIPPEGSGDGLSSSDRELQKEMSLFRFPHPAESAVCGFLYARRVRRSFDPSLWGGFYHEPENETSG